MKVYSLMYGLIIICGGILTAHAQPSRSVGDGVYTQSQADQGEQHYQEACAACHGTDLGGVGMAPALAGPEFLWIYDGLPLQVLFQRIVQTMPPEAPDSIGRSDKADITAYLLQQNGFPDGDVALSSNSTVLGMIQWLAMDANH